MRTTAPIAAAAALLAMGSASWAAENTAGTGSSGGTPRMQGSPNAAGFGKAETTGTAGANTPDTTPGENGKMKGPPNAAEFQHGTPSGSPSGR